MSLKKNKPYAEVCGIGIAYKYEQDDKFFDQHGNEVTANGKTVIGGESIDPAAVHEKPDVKDAHPEKTAIDQTQSEENPVPEIGLDQVDGSVVKAPEDGVDKLSRDELKDLLNKMDVKYKVRESRPDLLALLRDELKARNIEASQEEIEKVEQ